jgi:hypothetical protein
MNGEIALGLDRMREVVDPAVTFRQGRCTTNGSCPDMPRTSSPDITRNGIRQMITAPDGLIAWCQTGSAGCQ